MPNIYTKNIVIPATYIKTRLDRYIKTLYPLITHGTIQKLLREKKIKLNDMRIDANYRVVVDDILNIRVDLDQYCDNAQDNSTKNTIYNNAVKILASKILSQYLIYEDDDLIAINKPHNLSTQGGVNVHLSIDHAIHYLNLEHQMNLKIIHRLDKETSGILLIAKNLISTRAFGELFRENSIYKTYIAVLVGSPQQDEGTITSEIGKTRNSQNKFVVSTDAIETKQAISHYKIIAKNNNLSLCIFKPITGRMHQLRHHANLLGCYILGDDKYWISSAANKHCSSFNMIHNRLMLHAYNIEIPIINLSVTAPLDDVLEQYITTAFILKLKNGIFQTSI